MTHCIEMHLDTTDTLTQKISHMLCHISYLIALNLLCQINLLLHWFFHCSWQPVVQSVTIQPQTPGAWLATCLAAGVFFLLQNVGSNSLSYLNSCPDHGWALWPWPSGKTSARTSWSKRSFLQGQIGPCWQIRLDVLKKKDITQLLAFVCMIH